MSEETLGITPDQSTAVAPAIEALDKCPDVAPTEEVAVPGQQPTQKKKKASKYYAHVEKRNEDGTCCLELLSDTSKNGLKKQLMSAPGGCCITKVCCVIRGVELEVTTEQQITF